MVKTEGHGEKEKNDSERGTDSETQRKKESEMQTERQHADKRKNEHGTMRLKAGEMRHSEKYTERQ